MKDYLVIENRKKGQKIKDDLTSTWFELWTYRLPGQPSTTELKYFGIKRSTYFQIKNNYGVCGHHIPLGEIAWKIP